MTTSITRLGDQLRAIIFINHVVACAGCERTPSALRRWGEAFEERVGLCRAEGGDSGKWEKYLKGRLPAGPLRTALMAEFPALEQVMRNPLWAVLHQLEAPDAAAKFSWNA